MPVLRLRNNRSSRWDELSFDIRSDEKLEVVGTKTQASHSCSQRRTSAADSSSSSRAGVFCSWLSCCSTEEKAAATAGFSSSGVSNMLSSCRIKSSFRHSSCNAAQRLRIPSGSRGTIACSSVWTSGSTRGGTGGSRTFLLEERLTACTASVNSVSPIWVRALVRTTGMPSFWERRLVSMRIPFFKASSIRLRHSTTRGVISST